MVSRGLASSIHRGLRCPKRTSSVMGLSPTASAIVMMFSAGMLLRAIWDWVVRLGMWVRVSISAGVLHTVCVIHVRASMSHILHLSHRFAQDSALFLLVSSCTFIKIISGLA
nr:MAG TPA: hypothetical protein [Caudoviricetes sp.]